MMQPFQRGMELPSKDTVVKVWEANGIPFARLLDGRIAVQRLDGTIKTYRPHKSIVIGKNPRLGSVLRAEKKLSRLRKGLKRFIK